MATPTEDIERWSKRAEECRRFADDVQFSPEARAGLMYCAEQYEQMIARRTSLNPHNDNRVA